MCFNGSDPSLNQNAYRSINIGTCDWKLYKNNTGIVNNIIQKTMSVKIQDETIIVDVVFVGVEGLVFRLESRLKCLFTVPVPRTIPATLSVVVGSHNVYDEGR